MGKVVVMGRKTLESFPGGQPLKKRTNIVLTGDKNYKVKDAIVVNTVEALLEELKQYGPGEYLCDWRREVFTVSFFHIVRLPISQRLTYAYEADTYFPNLDEMPEWKVTGVSEEQTYFNLEYEFVKYERIG